MSKQEKNNESNSINEEIKDIKEETEEKIEGNNEEGNLKDNKKGVKVKWYIKNALFVIAYIMIGLVVGVYEQLWNHGLFGGGAEVIPVAIEIVVFLAWIIVGLIGLFRMGQRKIKKVFKILITVLVIVVIVIGTYYCYDVVIPDAKMRNRFKKIEKEADARYVHTGENVVERLFYDVDEMKLYYTCNYIGEEIHRYSTIYDFKGEKTDKKFEDLQEDLVMHKFNDDEGNPMIYCLSDKDFYYDYKDVYWLVDGQMYHISTEDITIGAELEELWNKHSEDAFRKRNGQEEEN